MSTDEPVKSKAPDEFLKRNKLEGVDPAIVLTGAMSTIDLTQLDSILQPKEGPTVCDETTNL